MLFDQLDAKEAAAHSHFEAALGGFTQDDLGYSPKKPWGEGYYYPEETEKQAIVLHYTMGALLGDIETLTNSGSAPQGHVSVSFVVGRNGNVYRLFDPKYWSYHLGPGTVGGNHERSSSTIGIELSNRGPLKLNPAGDTLIDAYNQAYCRLDQTQAYSKLETPFRDFSHFATFTDAQYAAVTDLLPRLGELFSVPLTVLPEATRYQTFDETAAPAYRGVCSHVNFRPTGKTDVGPAFRWDQIGF